MATPIGGCIIDGTTLCCIPFFRCGHRPVRRNSRLVVQKNWQSFHFPVSPDPLVSALFPHGIQWGILLKPMPFARELLEVVVPFAEDLAEEVFQFFCI